jgi:hypothetical protein
MEYQTITSNVLSLRDDVSANIYSRFIHCLLIKPNEAELKTTFYTFCEKYNIENSDDTYSFLMNMKETKQHYKNFAVTDSSILGNLFFFIVHYMKQNPNLFKYMHQMLFLMKATFNMKAQIDVNENSDIDSEVEQLMMHYERIDNMIELNKNIESISKNLNDTTIYKTDQKISHCLDSDYLNFKLIE